MLSAGTTAAPRPGPRGRPPIAGAVHAGYGARAAPPRPGASDGEHHRHAAGRRCGERAARAGSLSEPFGAFRSLSAPIGALRRPSEPSGRSCLHAAVPVSAAQRSAAGPAVICPAAGRCFVSSSSAAAAGSSRHVGVLYLLSLIFLFCFPPPEREAKETKPRGPPRNAERLRRAGTEQPRAALHCSAPRRHGTARHGTARHGEMVSGALRCGRGR